ncbi:MAG: cyanophycinase [Trueperaceae bacterium]|nr:cyanophycinase [Trueperaceae bacterium]
MTPPKSGALIAIGGAEDRTTESAVLKRVLDLVPGEPFDVGVITTASRYPADAFSAYLHAFEAFGARAVHHLDVPDRAAAHDPAQLAILDACGLIFISGGDQLRLTNVLGGSPFLTAIRERHAAGAVVAGTSAGAAALTATMIYDGDAANALRKGAVKMAAGLAFARGIVIDSHFLERGRFTRLMEVGTTNPEYVGVGIGEDAAVVIHPGPVLEAVGPGLVIVVDSSQLRHTNVVDLEVGEPVAVEHVIMHALASGYGYDVKRRAFIHAHDEWPVPHEDDPA